MLVDLGQEFPGLVEILGFGQGGGTHPVELGRAKVKVAVELPQKGRKGKPGRLALHGLQILELPALGLLHGLDFDIEVLAVVLPQRFQTGLQALVGHIVADLAERAQLLHPGLGLGEVGFAFEEMGL